MTAMTKATNLLTHLFIYTRDDSGRKTGTSSAWVVFTAALSFFFVVILSLLFSCVDDDESPFARRPAFFRFSPVTAAPKTLFPALGSPGEWCTVTLTNTHYVLKTPGGMTDSYPLTQLDEYRRATWICGLIVGTPTVPDLGAYDFAPVAYDLACPSCFEGGGITRAVSITSTTLGRASCSRCHRTYDINNGGIVVEGASSPHDPRLYRYRCNYANDTFVVQN